MEEWSAIAKEYNPIKVGSIDATDTQPHDKGIVRALKASYHSNESGDPRKTIFIGRLNLNTSQEVLEACFKRFGKIAKVRLVRDVVTNFSKGYAFIEYMHRHEAKEAILQMNHQVLEERKVLVLWECERVLPGWVPRRLGGGFGGRKESGQLRFGGEEKPWRRPLTFPLVRGRVDGGGARGGERRGEGEVGGERRKSGCIVKKEGEVEREGWRLERDGVKEKREDNHSRSSSKYTHSKETRHDGGRETKRSEKKSRSSREKDSQERKKKRSHVKEEKRSRENISKEKSEHKVKRRRRSSETPSKDTRVDKKKKKKKKK